MASTFKPYPVSGWPLGERELLKAQTPNPLEYFLRYYARHDAVLFWDDFNLKALDTTNVYSVAAGGTATTWALNALEDGVVRGVSGTTAATSGLQLSIPLVTFAGARNYGCEIRFKLSVVTETRIEAGFVDALPAVNTSLVNSLATPSFNTVAKACLYVFDNASSTNTAGLYGIGASPVVAANKTAVTTGLPTAATYTTWRIQAMGAKAAVWVDGNVVAQPTADVLGSADLVEFVFSHKKSDTTTSNIDIDYIILWKDRNTTNGV